MHFSKLVPAAFLAASFPAAMAEWRVAVGSHFVNVGGGPRASPGSTFDRLQIYNENGDQIYLVETPEWGTGLCTDLYTATAGAMGMKDDFSWGASCAAPGKIKYVNLKKNYLSPFDRFLELVTCANTICNLENAMALLGQLLILRARTPTTLILLGMVLELDSKMLVWFSLSVSLLKGEERLRLWA